MRKQLHFKHSLLLATLSACFWLGIPAHAQNSRPAADSDVSRSELGKFDQFLDSHPETAEQLRKDPSLINNREFVTKHDNLKEFLEQNPGVREELRENPNAFMHQEQRFDRRDDGQDRRDRDFKGRDNDRADVAKFDQFLDSHPETAEQLRKDPSLVNNREFIEKHENLKEFLAQNPGVQDEIRENPNAFMHQEQRFDRREDGQARDYKDRDFTGRDNDQRGNDRRDNDRRDVAKFDQFLDSHPETAEQLRKDPSLVNNKDFIEKHDNLKDFLAANPGVSEQIKENPNAFMHQEQRFDRREDGAEMASFNEFLGGHSNVAQQLSRDPSLAKNQEYIESHPELQQYLKAHPGVQQQLAQNPQVVMKSAQPATTTTPGTKPVDPNLKPKQ
jgi:phage-related protein